MTTTYGLAAFCAVGAAIAVSAYLLGLRQVDRLRPLPMIALFCTGMALWQLATALLYGLGAGATMNIVFAAAFLLMGVIGQIAASFRFRIRTDDRQADKPAA